MAEPVLPPSRKISFGAPASSKPTVAEITMLPITSVSVTASRRFGSRRQGGTRIASSAGSDYGCRIPSNRKLVMTGYCARVGIGPGGTIPIASKTPRGNSKVTGSQWALTQV